MQLVISKWSRVDAELTIDKNGVDIRQIKSGERWFMPYELIKNYASWAVKGFLGLTGRTQYESTQRAVMLVFTKANKDNAHKAELAISIFIRHKLEDLFVGAGFLSAELLSSRV